jgi:hypothetical protein
MPRQLALQAKPEAEVPVRIRVLRVDLDSTPEMRHRPSTGCAISRTPVELRRRSRG